MKGSVMRHLLNYMSTSPPTSTISEPLALPISNSQFQMPPREGRSGEVCLHPELAGEYHATNTRLVALFHALMQKDYCTICGHLFDPHLMWTYDALLGGWITCPVKDCDCYATWDVPQAERFRN